MKRLVLVLALVLVALPVAAWGFDSHNYGDNTEPIAVQGYGDQVATFQQGYVHETDKECGNLERTTINISKLKTSFDCNTGGDICCYRGGDNCGLNVGQSSCDFTKTEETLSGHFRYATDAQWVVGSAAMNTLGGLSLCGMSRCGPDATAGLSQTHGLNLTAADVQIAGGTFGHTYSGSQTLNLNINPSNGPQ